MVNEEKVEFLIDAFKSVCRKVPTCDKCGAKEPCYMISPNDMPSDWTIETIIKFMEK